MNEKVKNNINGRNISGKEFQIFSNI